MDRLFYPLAAALACGASPVFAVDTPAADAETAATDANQIVVTGERVAYGVKATSTATKTPTDIRNIPQALTIVSKAQIDDQQLRSVGDLLLFVPGASYNSGEGNRDTLVLRGNSSTADFFVDGVRDDVQYFRDFYNVERIEVLKGPNAMIFGRGGGGGIVNRVMKRPSLNAYTATREELVQRAGEVLGWIRDGKLKLRTEFEFPLKDAAQAHRALEGRQTTGKVLLVP